MEHCDEEGGGVHVADFRIARSVLWAMVFTYARVRNGRLEYVFLNIYEDQDFITKSAHK